MLSSSILSAVLQAAGTEPSKPELTPERQQSCTGSKLVSARAEGDTQKRIKHSEEFLESKDNKGGEHHEREAVGTGQMMFDMRRQCHTPAATSPLM